MFSGIVETTGTILKRQDEHDLRHFIIKSDMSFDDIHVGESIAVNGVCLTVTFVQDSVFHVTAVQETLCLTNIQYLKETDTVNLERSLKYGARIGGHCVQGHVDGMGKILEVSEQMTKISIPEGMEKYIVHKGFITLDGMSITIVDVQPQWFKVTLIPHTKAVTIAKNYEIGSLINIEVDVMAKNIEKLLGDYKNAFAY